MMKKIFAGIMAAVFLLSGCQNNTPNPSEIPVGTDKPIQFPPEKNAQNQYLLADATSFQETDGFFCGTNLLGSYLQFYDKESGISGILCADPACTHESDECGAYIKKGANLSYYDGSLYWITEDADSRDNCLWQSDLSGMNRKEIMQISFENVIYPYQPQRYVIHQGKLYIMGHAGVVDGTQSGYRVSLLSGSLSADEDFTVVYDEVFSGNTAETYRFVGDAVYLSLVTYENITSFDLTVIKFDINNHTSTVVYQQANLSENPGAIWVTEDHELYLPAMKETEAYLWKLEDNTRKEITSWSAEKMSAPKVMDGIAMSLSLEGNERWVDIRNFSGEAVYSGKLYPSSVPGLDGDPNTYSTSLVGGDEEKLIFQLIEPTGTKNYTVLLDLKDHMKATVLWSSEN